MVAQDWPDPAGYFLNDYRRTVPKYVFGHGITFKGRGVGGAKRSVSFL